MKGEVRNESTSKTWLQARTVKEEFPEQNMKKANSTAMMVLGLFLFAACYRLTNSSTKAWENRPDDIAAKAMEGQRACFSRIGGGKRKSL